MSTRDWALAIDFGTSNTAAAHTGPVSGEIETLQLGHDRTTMSSAVFVESPDHVSVGDVAANRAEANPSGFIPSPKRSVSQGTVHANGYDVHTSVPIAAVLRAVMERARAAHAGSLPTELVLTHPEDWSPREVRVLLDAAAALGPDTPPVRTVSEPRAAAHYYSGARTLEQGTRIAVFDFGGGTLDVAVLEADAAGGFEVVAARGDNGLGGKNFDAHLRRWLDQQIENRDPDLLRYLRTGAPLEVRFALDESIRRAKELLSESPSATITVAAPDGAEKFLITREEFEEAIERDLGRAATLTSQTLSDAGITAPTQLEALYLTGGSSRIPVVHERLRDLGPIATLDDPKTVVARGALSAAAGADATDAGPDHTRPFTVPMRRAESAESAPSAGSTGAGGETSARPGRRGLIAAAVAAVVLVAGGATAYALLSGDDQGAETASSEEAAPGDGQTGSGDGQTAGGQDAPGATPPTTKEGVVAALPSALASAVSDCELVGETQNGGLQLRCDIAEGQPLLDGIAAEDFRSVIVSVDIQEARTKVVRLRQKSGYDASVEHNEVVENTSRTAAALVQGPRLENLYDISYANHASGVMVSFDDAIGLEGAKTFLTRAGLIN